MIEIQQEPERVSSPTLIWSLLVVLLGIAASALFTVLLSSHGPGAHVEIGERALPLDNTRPVDSGLFGRPSRAERDARRARARLAGYGWVDRERGKVHVPLEVALEIYLDEQGAGP